MLSELPDDIWLEIAENHLLDEPTCSNFSYRKVDNISNLALASKRLRGILLRYVYRSLTFTVTDNRGFADVASDATHHQRRAIALQKNRHLLLHVQELVLSGWSKATRVVKYDPLLVSSKRLDDFRILVSSTLDMLSDLVPHMHGLRRVELFDSAVADRLHHSVLSHRTLDTLRITPMSNDIVWYTPLGPSPRLHIRHLELVDLYSSSTSVYFSHLLQCCILSLISLRVPAGILSDVLSVAAGKRLALRTLVVTRYVVQRVFPEEWLEIYRLLPSCPEIRRLEINGPWPSQFPLPPLNADTLPQLESIQSPLEFIQALVPGRLVRRVDVRGRIDEHPLPFSLGLPPPFSMHIQHLTMCGVFDLVKNSRMFLEYFHSFQNMTILEVTGFFKVLRKPTSIKRLCQRFADDLVRLPNLRICRIRNLKAGGSPFVSDCPIARMHDPEDRGHPALERLEFLSHHEWRWLPTEGWTF